MDESNLPLTDEKKQALHDAQRMKDRTFLVDKYRNTPLKDLSVLASNILRDGHTEEDILAYQREYTKDNYLVSNEEMYLMHKFMLDRISNEEREKYFYRCWGRKFLNQ